jgi:hypothetical protein
MGGSRGGFSGSQATLTRTLLRELNVPGRGAAVLSQFDWAANIRLDRVVAARSDVREHRSPTPPPQRRFQGPDHVGRVGDVAALAAVAVDDW